MFLTMSTFSPILFSHLVTESAQSSNGEGHVSDEVKQLKEKICALEAAKDSQAMEQVELHDKELVNNKIINQLQQDIELLKVNLHSTVEFVLTASYHIELGKLTCQLVWISV